jgi:hypothetical protein
VWYFSVDMNAAAIRSRVSGLNLRRGLNRAFIVFWACWVVYWVVVFHWSEANRARREAEVYSTPGSFRPDTLSAHGTARPWDIVGVEPTGQAGLTPDAFMAQQRTRPPSFVPDTLPADFFSRSSSAQDSEVQAQQRARQSVAAQAGAARAGPIHKGSGFWLCFKSAFRKSMLKSEPPGVEFTVRLVGPLLLYCGALVLIWIVRGFRTAQGQHE